MINIILDKREAIQSLAHTAVESHTEGFQAVSEGEVDDPNGPTNMKIHNVFVATLGPDIQYYSSFVRSLDTIERTYLN